MAGDLFGDDGNALDRSDLLFLAGWRELSDTPAGLGRRASACGVVTGTLDSIWFAVRIVVGSPQYALVRFACGRRGCYEWTGVEPIVSGSSWPVRVLVKILRGEQL